MAGSKKQVLYIHGGESFLDREDFLNRIKTKDIWDLPKSLDEPKSCKWTDTMAADLGSDYEVFTPTMPNKQNAKYVEWKIWFERHFEYLNDGVILAGCSLGAMFLGRYLTEEDLPFKTGAVILMAAALPLDDIDTTDCGDFLIDLEKVSVISEKHDKVVILHSKDDFLVPFSHGEKLAEALPAAEFITFEDKNHFLIEEFPELIENIKKLA